MYHPYQLSTPPQPSDTSLVRVNGDELAAKVKLRIAELKPKVSGLLKKIDEISQDYHDKAVAKNLLESEYIKSQAIIDIKKALEASIEELPPKGVFQALFGNKEYTVNIKRLTAEINSLTSQMPKELKNFWTFKRVVYITDRFNLKEYVKNYKKSDLDVDFFRIYLLENYETSIRQYRHLISNRGFGRYSRTLEDYDYSAFEEASNEYEKYMGEVRRLSRYENLKGDVFLAINEYNALGELV